MASTSGVQSAIANLENHKRRVQEAFLTGRAQVILKTAKALVLAAKKERRTLAQTKSDTTTAYLRELDAYLDDMNPRVEVCLYCRCFGCLLAARGAQILPGSRAPPADAMAGRSRLRSAGASRAHTRVHTHRVTAVVAYAVSLSVSRD